MEMCGKINLNRCIRERLNCLIGTLTCTMYNEVQKPKRLIVPTFAIEVHVYVYLEFGLFF